ncbi:hypothetical protein IEO21_07442 [Rhodonia placenta]|uniref:Endopeptidase S2P n=1 Tax=Rhodonia placenta TaxID=104341 RepID=A0A8H7NYI8_9APHY|nr:hypothetical protein IEO21_07442 [Postia placenta]
MRRHTVKRALDDPEDFQTTANSPFHAHIPVYAIIPGVTVPISHLPLLVLALVANQFIHELGHALTAALESVPLLSIGASLTLVFPSAFVALSSAATQALAPRGRMRISSSGAFHNLLLWLVLNVAARAGADRLLWSGLQYADTSAWGRVVVGVEQSSPLYGYLAVGSIITHIDDHPLLTSDATTDLWSTSLSHHVKATPEGELGWCVARSSFVEQPISCCGQMAVPAPHREPLACFVTHEPLWDERCLDPLPYLSDPAPSAHVKRCTSTTNCGEGHICTRLRDDQELVRLTVHTPVWASDGPADSVVVWSGPRAEILVEVDVSTWTPRMRLLPVRLPVLVGAFISYVQMLSLSLYFFNMLPVSFLDGGPFLDAAADFAVMSSGGTLGVREDVELAALEGGPGSASHRPSPGGEWKSRLQRTLHYTSIILFGSCCLLGLVRTLG